MKSTYNLLKRGTVGFMTCIALDGYRRAVMRDSKVRESDRLLQDAHRKYELAIKQIEEKEDLLASNNTEIVASLGRIKQGVDLVNRDTQNLANQISINNSQGIETSHKVLNISTSNVVNEINKLMDKVNSRPGSNDNQFNSVFEFRDFFGSYTTAQLGAIGHIFACIFIFGCLFDITVAYYGDYLIIYFKLEEKYP